MDLSKQASQAARELGISRQDKLVTFFRKIYDEGFRTGQDSAADCAVEVADKTQPAEECACLTVKELLVLDSFIDYSQKEDSMLEICESFQMDKDEIIVFLKKMGREPEDIFDEDEVDGDEKTTDGDAGTSSVEVSLDDGNADSTIDPPADGEADDDTDNRD